MLPPDTRLQLGKELTAVAQLH